MQIEKLKISCAFYASLNYKYITRPPKILQPGLEKCQFRTMNKIAYIKC